MSYRFRKGKSIEARQCTTAARASSIDLSVILDYSVYPPSPEAVLRTLDAAYAALREDVSIAMRRVSEDPSLLKPSGPIQSHGSLDIKEVPDGQA